MKKLIVSAICLASFSALASSPIVENIEGCLGTKIIKDGTKKNEKIVFESKAVIFRADLEYQKVSHRFAADKFDLGHVVVLMGTRHNGYHNQYGHGLQKNRLNDGAGSLMLELNLPDNPLFIATQTTEAVYLTESEVGKVSAVLERSSFSGGQFNLDTCSDDPEVVKTWIQEVSKYSPF
jgi:hypothetical protein